MLTLYNVNLNYYLLVKNKLLSQWQFFGLLKWLNVVFFCPSQKTWFHIYWYGLIISNLSRETVQNARTKQLFLMCCQLSTMLYDPNNSTWVRRYQRSHGNRPSDLIETKPQRNPIGLLATRKSGALLLFLI